MAPPAHNTESYNGNESFLLKNRMDYWSKRFDQVALKHYMAYITEKRRQRHQSGESTSSSTSSSVGYSRSSSPVSSIGGSSFSTSASCYQPGFVHVLEQTDYKPSEVDMTILLDGRLQLKGSNFAGFEFHEFLQLPENIDEEELTIDVNRKGKLVIRAPYL